jgi:hypothetical protein
VTNPDETHWCIGFKTRQGPVRASDRETRATLLAGRAFQGQKFCLWKCLGATVRNPHAAFEGLG